MISENTHDLFADVGNGSELGVGEHRVEFFLVKQADHPHDTEVGAEIHINGVKFFIDYRQEEFKGVRIGAYPLQKHQTIHEAELIS